MPLMHSMNSIPAAETGSARGTTPGSARAIIGDRATSDGVLDIRVSEVFIGMRNAMTVRAVTSSVRNGRSQSHQGDDRELYSCERQHIELHEVRGVYLDGEVHPCDDGPWRVYRGRRLCFCSKCMVRRCSMSVGTLSKSV